MMKMLVGFYYVDLHQVACGEYFAGVRSMPTGLSAVRRISAITTDELT
ncbi:hypothetical protein [Sphingomonas prati]|nr:hypothetical protein [Sphingomonas prati]